MLGFRWNHTPVFLTTSQEEAEIVRSNQLQANFHLNKPLPLEAFATLVKSINDFWLTRVKLPPQRQSI